MFFTLTMRPVLKAVNTLKNSPRKMHTELPNAAQHNEVFRKGSWHGDSAMRLLNTTYLFSKYPEMPLKELDPLRSTMLSNVVHANLAKQMKIVEKAAGKKFAARCFKFYAQAIQDAKGFDAMQKWYNRDIGPKCEEMAKSMMKK